MAYQSIGVGTLAGDGTGDTLRVGGTKVNANFTELYDLLGDGSDLTSGISVSGNTITLTTPIIAEIDSGSTITLDATTDIVLDADGGDIFFKDDGTTFGSATNTSGNLIIKSGTTTAATFSGANVTLAGTVQGTTITATTALNPSASDAASIGTSALEWSDLYLADGAVIYFGDDQDIPLTHVADTGLRFDDSDKLAWGAGSDLTIHSDGTNALLTAGTQLTIYTETFGVSNAGASETMMTAVNGGAVTLYYDNSAKLATASGGVSVTGDLTTSGTVEPAGDTASGDNAAIGYTSGEGLILTGQGSTSDITLKNDADATVFTVPTGTDDILFPDSAKAMWGAGSDLQIYHDGSNSYISDQGTGNLTLMASQVNMVNAAGSETIAQFNQDGAVGLYYDNTAALATKSGGGTLTGTWEVTTALVPDASDGAGLGTASLEWSDLFLADGAVINFGDDADVSLTHIADTGLLLNSTMAIQFNDASQYINAPSATVLDINATDEVEVNATLMDVNANLEISGTTALTGVATFSAAPVFPDGSINIMDLDIDGASDIGAAIVDADLFIIDDGAGGANRKTTAARVRTYVGFPATTVMLFQQAAAPTGWTKLTATNSESLADASIRVIGSESFNVGVNGSVAFTTAFASKSVAGNIAGNSGATTLQTAQIPSHTHTVGIGSDNKQSGSSNTGNAGSATQNSGATGGGGSHTHAVGNLAFTGTAINMAVKYVDVILASKDA